MIKCPYCRVYLQRRMDRMAIFCPTCKREVSREALDRWAAQNTGIALSMVAERDVSWLKTMNIRWN